LIIGLAKDGTIRLFNGEAERVTGYGRDEVLGRSFIDELVPEQLRDEQRRTLERAGSGDEPAGADSGAIRTRSGTVRDVTWRFVSSPSEIGDGVTVFAIGQDTTDQKLLEERRRQSEKLAAIGTLAAGLAHEIRNPLNGALLHLSFLSRALKRTGAGDETLETVNVVADEMRRLAGLVNEFLDFARPKPLNKRPVSVVALFERVVDLMTEQAQAAHVAIRTEIPPKDIVLSADGAKLEQVLLNLLRNAVEALASREGAVTLRAQRQPRVALLEVEDDGPGLSQPDAPIFDAFFSTKPGGTGLGLAIVHRIVTDHGGTVDVESRPGRTVFRVELPVDLGT
jgi:PAS domain S-box-containing protein